MIIWSEIIIHILSNITELSSYCYHFLQGIKNGKENTENTVDILMINTDIVPIAD